MYSDYQIVKNAYNEEKQKLYKLEKEENYDACAGILKAINAPIPPPINIKMIT